MKTPFLRTAFNYDRNLAGDESGLDCSDFPSLCQQSFADECDINTIVRRFGVSGELPTGVRMPTYGDFVGVKDFHTAMNAVAKAHEAFDAMPASVRTRFHNDPGEFVAFCSDADNRKEAIKMGLVAPQLNDLVPTGVPVPVSAAAAPAPSDKPSV
jgi:phage internal scaffolding protein